MLRGGSWNQSVFDKVADYRVYSLTLPGNLESLPAIRRRWKNELARADAKGHDEFNAALLARCFPLAIGELPPGGHLDDPVARAAVQVNSMLVVADLNQQEAAGQTPATPLPAALPKLIDAWRRPDLSDAVRAVVLQGLKRHAEAGLPDEQRAVVQKAMLDLLKAKTPPPTRDALVHDWLRRSAAEALAAIGGAGLTDDSAEVVEALLSVIGDTDQSLAMRGAAAQSLGKLNLKAPSGMNLSLAAHQVGRLAVEMARAKPDSVARIKGNLQRIHEALAGVGAGRGLAAAADETHKPYIANLQQQFAPIKQAVDKMSDTDPPAIPKAAQDGATALAQWLDANAPQSKELLAAAKASP